ncbi:MAG TPA: aminotransferase class V-fold PLP-dependent enzyme [Chthoniobacteraceae bacterium]|nr:aminotransferase class V-fold PLP-dependent enzyme [Chthoniobacteraceae bacterium]
MLITPQTVRPRPKLGLGAALIGEEEEALLLQAVRSKRLNRYQEEETLCAALEREVCERMGVKYALAVTSGTAALEVALAALGVGPGDEVIIPAWSWVSCFTAVVRLGALPVLAEMDESFSLASGEIRRLANERTKAVMIMHYQGVAAEMEPLLAEAREVGLAVLEDGAQSPGARYHGKAVGSMGDIGIYSFQIQKSITSGEGGMVVTSDPALYERAVRMHDLGFYRPHFNPNLEPRGSAFCGGQYRMSELTAAVALAQLRKLETIRSHCRRLSARIDSRIAELPGLTPRRIPDPEGDSGFEIYRFLPDRETAMAFRERLDARNVNCARMTGTYCQYARDYCKNRAVYTPAASPFARFETWPAQGYRPVDFPRTESLIGRFISLPLGVLYTDEDADHIAEAILETAQELGLSNS